MVNETILLTSFLGTMPKKGRGDQKKKLQNGGWEKQVKIGPKLTSFETVSLKTSVLSRDDLFYFFIIGIKDCKNKQNG